MTQQQQDGATRAEQREREEMFSFHPEILGEAGELPRRLSKGAPAAKPPAPRARPVTEP